MNAPRLFGALVFAILSAMVVLGCGTQEDAEQALHPVHGTVPGGRSVHISPPERLQAFKDALTKAGIPFHIATFRGNEYVVWAFKDTEAVIAVWTFEPEGVKMLRHMKAEFETPP